MKVLNITDIPPGTAKIGIIFEGSGDPSDEHQIVGVVFYDKNEHWFSAVGVDPNEGGIKRVEW